MSEIEGLLNDIGDGCEQCKYEAGADPESGKRGGTLLKKN